MKKILFLLLGLTIAVGASAGVDTWNQKHDAIMQKRHPALEQRFKSHNMQHKATKPTKLRGETPQVITEQPAGQLVTYKRSGGYIERWNDPNAQYGHVMVVYDPDGTTVYVKGLAFGVHESAWVTGTIANGKITIPLGQYVWTYYEDGEYWYGLYLAWGSIEKDQDSGKNVFTPDPDVTAVTYTIDGDNITLDNSNGGNEGDGATGLVSFWDDEDDFYNFEWGTVFTPDEITIPEVITEQPEGELVTYGRENYHLSSYNYPSYDFGEPIDVVYAPDGETVYIRDIIFEYYEYNTWVRGTISGGKIHVPLGQYIYFDLVGESVYLDWGSAAIAPDNEDGIYFTFTPDPTATEVIFTINGDNLIMDNSTGDDYGDGATGLAMMVEEGYLDGDPFFTMYYNTFLSPYVEPTVIEDQPEGELVTYQRSGYYFSGNYRTQGGEVNIVYAPDGKTVYIQDIICYSGFGSWVMGTIENGKIHVPLKQFIYWQDPKKQNNRGNGGWGYMLAFGQTYYNENYNEYMFDYDPSITEATFTIDGNVISLDGTSFSSNDDMDGATGLVAVYSDYPTYFAQCDINTVFTIPSPMIDEQPEGELVTYSRSGYLFSWDGEVSQQDGTANIVYAPDGETVYIQDIINNGYGTWVRGTIEGDKIHVPTGQTIAIYDYNKAPTKARAIPGNRGGTEYIVLTAGQVVPDPDYDGGYILDYDPSVTEITFSIDGDNISLDNTSFGPNGGADGAMVIAASYLSAPQYFDICDLLTVFGEPQAEPTIIFDQPEGTYQKYFRSIHTSDYKDRDQYYRNGIAEMVYSDTGNEVYIKGIVYGLSSAWVKGTIEGNKIHVPLGQYLDIDGDYYAKLSWVYETIETNVYGEYIETHPDYNVTEATFTIDGDKITLDENNEWSTPQNQHESLGVCWYNSSGTLTNVWPANLEIQFMPYFVPTVIEDMPEGELVTYYRRGHAIGHMSEMYLKDRNYDDYCIWPHQYFNQDDLAYVVYAPDGRTVYLCEPVQCRANVHEPRYTWVAGTLSEDGHKIIVPLEQYVTWNPSTYTAERLGWGTSYLRTNRYGEDEIYIVPDNSVMSVSYTIEDGFLSMDDATNGSPSSKSDWVQGHTGLTITDQFGHWCGELNWGTKYAGDHPAVPMDPVVVEWEDNGDENGNSALLTMCEPTDVDGYGLDEQGFSYSIYTDNGKLFTFEASKYGLDEDVTEVTYDMWQDNWRLYPDCIYFYRTNAEGYEPFFNWRIGIQLHYTYNGVKQSSNIVYLEVFEKPDEPAVPGDVNGDGKTSIADVTALINMLLSGTGFNSVSDVNGDGKVSIADVTTLINMLLSSN